MRLPSFVSDPACLPLCCALVFAACGTQAANETGNVLPTATQTDTSDAEGEGEAESEGESSTTGGQTGVPATYRFTCIDIQQAGSAGDGDIQTNLLQQQWGADIDDYKLNILVDFQTLDEMTGEGTMQIRSGIGTSDDDQCSEPNSDSSVVDVAFDPSVTAFVADNSAERCTGPATGGETSYGTFSLSTGPQEVVYIYAEDNSGNAFNCTTDTSPDAVPIHAIDAQFTLSEDEQIAHGELTGCLVESEAEALCSCLGACVPPSEPYDQCGCNPDAPPLRELLLGVTDTENCTTIMGETAFDVKIAFTAERLPNVPEACG